MSDSKAKAFIFQRYNEEPIIIRSDAILAIQQFRNDKSWVNLGDQGSYILEIGFKELAEMLDWDVIGEVRAELE